MKQTQNQTPDRLTAKDARIRARAADHIARGKGHGSKATGQQRLRARALAGQYHSAADFLEEVDSE